MGRFSVFSVKSQRFLVFFLWFVMGGVRAKRVISGSDQHPHTFCHDVGHILCCCRCQFGLTHLKPHPFIPSWSSLLGLRAAARKRTQMPVSCSIMSHNVVQLYNKVSRAKSLVYHAQPLIPCILITTRVFFPCVEYARRVCGPLARC